MKIYIVKLFIALIFVYIAFEITIGPKLNIISSNINKLNDINYRGHVKNNKSDADLINFKASLSKATLNNFLDAK